MRQAVIGSLVVGILAAGAAVCQQANVRPRTSISLPDAPSASLSKSSHLSFGIASTHTLPASGILRSFRPLAGLQRLLTADRNDFLTEAAVAAYKEPSPAGDAIRSYLYSALRTPALNYRASAQSSLMRRATEAASQTFLARNLEGKARLNTPYVLGVLGSAVLHTAYRPYWNRPVSAPFSDFGSRIGNDAGMNLLHEFGPGLQQAMKNHTPKFVSRIEASVERR